MEAQVKKKPKHSILMGEECIQGYTQGRKAFIGEQTDSLMRTGGHILLAAL